MTNPQNDFFTISNDRETNRDLVYAISKQIVEQIRPDESMFSTYAFEPLMDLAAHDQVAQVGREAELAFGGAELLMMVVVPVVTSALTTIFLQARAGGIAGVEELPEGELVRRAQIEQLVRQSQVRLTRSEIDALHRQTNVLVLQHVSQAIEQPPPPERCCRHECSALRLRLNETLTSEDLRNICFDLNLPHEDIVLPNQPYSSQVRMLIEYSIKRGLICKVISYIYQQYPHTRLDDTLSA
jgi:hypothetical protein